MSYNLTRWIEDADARRCHEAARFDRRFAIRETQHLHLGKAIAGATSWFRQNVSRAAPAPRPGVGCHVVAFCRHPREHG